MVSVILLEHRVGETMKENPARGIQYFAATCLGLNYADFASTMIVLSRGAVESNPFFVFLGGPFSPLSLMVKLVILPLSVLWVAYRGHVASPSWGMFCNAVLIGIMSLLCYAVATNVATSIILAAR